MALYAIPAITMAATISDIINKILDILQTVIPLLVAIAVIYFLWGVVQFITSAGDETKRTEGRNKIIYGLIGLAVMIAVWGLVNILLQTFDLEGGGAAPDVPELPTT